MGRHPQWGWVDKPYVESHVSPAEAEKRARLKAEIAALSAPLFGVELERGEVHEIRTRVESGKIAQRFPGSRSRGVE